MVVSYVHALALKDEYYYAIIICNPMIYSNNNYNLHNSIVQNCFYTVTNIATSVELSDLNRYFEYSVHRFGQVKSIDVCHKLSPFPIDSIMIGKRG